MIKLKDLLTEGISIRSTTYRGEDGFAIVGSLPGSNRRVNIFTTNRKSAEHIRDLVKAGKNVDVKDFQKHEGNARLTEAPDPAFERAAESFLSNAQRLIDSDMKKNYPNLPRRVLRFAKGRKYWRIEAVDQGQSHGSAWAFLNTENGDVLKPASFKTPAKHARGNIYDAHGGMGTVGVYGPAYMR